MARLRHDKAQIYVGTMAFAIVAAMISVVLIVFMVYGPPESRDYMYLVLTIEFGMLAIIVNSIVQIYLYERDLTKLSKDAASNLVLVQSCPDYYTRVIDPKGTATCSNAFVSPSTGDTYSIGRGADEGSWVSNGASVGIADYANKPLKDVCSDFSASKPLYNVPWTDLRVRCESYNLIA